MVFSVYSGFDLPCRMNLSKTKETVFKRRFFICNSTFLIFSENKKEAHRWPVLFRYANDVKTTKIALNFYAVFVIEIFNNKHFTYIIPIIIYILLPYIVDHTLVAVSTSLWRVTTKKILYEKYEYNALFSSFSFYWGCWDYFSKISIPRTE